MIAAGVPECWVVDLGTGEVLVLTGPAPHGYMHSATGSGDDVLVPSLPPAVPVAVTVAVPEALGLR